MYTHLKASTQVLWMGMSAYHVCIHCFMLWHPSISDLKETFINIFKPGYFPTCGLISSASPRETQHQLHLHFRLMSTPPPPH